MLFLKIQYYPLPGKIKLSFPSKGVNINASCRCPASWLCPFLCHICTNFQSICGPSSPLSHGSVSCWQIFFDFFGLASMFLQSLILTHTPFLSWRAQLPACALALAPLIRPPILYPTWKQGRWRLPKFQEMCGLNSFFLRWARSLSSA